MKASALLIVASLTLAGCETTPNVKTDYSPTANFSQYRSYSWAVTGVPRGMNPLLFQRVQGSIDRSLASRFARGNPGDFAVSFTVGSRDRVDVTDYGAYGPGWRRTLPYWDNIDVQTFTEGTLVIDIYDTRTKQPVWHGVATKDIDPGRVDQADIDEAVNAVLAKFPPR